MFLRNAILFSFRVAPVFASTLTFCSMTSAFPQDIKDLLDPADTASAIDLAKIPLKVDLFRSLALWVQDKGVSKQFTEELQGFQSAIAESVSDPGTGCLLKVRLYVNPDGAVAIPGGQLISFEETGKNPIDALAKSRMEGGIVVAESLDPPFENQSYYIWIKKEQGKLKAGLIPREWREKLEKQAQDEVERRKNMAKVYEAMESAGTATLSRDKYWSDIAQKQLATLRDDAERRKAQHLVQEFVTAQRSFDEAYQQFLQKEQELREQQERLQTLQTISRIAGLVSSAVQAGELASSNSNATVSAPQSSGQDATKIMIEYHEKQIDSLTGRIYEWGTRVELRGANLQQLENQLSRTFRTSDADQKLVVPHPR